MRKHLSRKTCQYSVSQIIISRLLIFISLINLVKDNAEESLYNVQEANEELTKAREYQKGNSDIFTTIFVTLTVILWVWEYYNTIYLIR